MLGSKTLMKLSVETLSAVTVDTAIVVGLRIGKYRRIIEKTQSSETAMYFEGQMEKEMTEFIALMSEIHGKHSEAIDRLLEIVDHRSAMAFEFGIEAAL